MGFDHSTRNFLYLVGKKVLTTVHVSFNESFDSLSKLPPAGIALRRSLGRDITLDPSAHRSMECTEMLDVLADSLSCRVKNWRRVLIGHFITRVGDQIVFSKDDAESERGA